MFTPHSTRRRGFTLIELLVVIAIIAILASILFPVFSKARERARAATCVSNMKQIGIGMSMYTQDYDEFLPEPGLQGVFRNAGNTGLGQLFMGVQPFHLAIQPYVKNYQVFACPSDDKRRNASIDRSGVRGMFIAANIPGATSLPAYSNTPAFHDAVAQIFPNSYATNYILSKTYGYTRRDNGVFVQSSDLDGSGYGGRGRSIVEIAETANTFIMSEYASATASGNGGYYMTPGYLNANGGLNERWRKGGRHFEGRNFLFVDGHVKWAKDVAFESSPGVAVAEAVIQAQYNSRQIYTTPQ
jgi:prepilin-type N-terminal cleavage/methylation domain-containing protein/prepilin-type processing-associated H-X9-DG protein